MKQSPVLRQMGLILGLAALYYLAAKIGLHFALVNKSVTAVWPPAGIALAAFVLLGYRVWPAILAAAFLANLTTTGAVLSSVGIAVGNTLEGLLGAYLVNRFARGGRVFDRVRDIFLFTALAALVSTTVSATIGCASLVLGGSLAWADAGPVWLTWWLGDAVGDIVIAPPLILWTGVKPTIRWSRRQVIEAIGLAFLTIVVAFVVFGGVFPSRHYPLTALVWPLLIWTALRFGPRESATVILIISAIAILQTLHSFGPFARPSASESLTLLQMWTGVTAVTGLVLAAVVAAQRDVEGTWRELAVTDPLTGLANHRQLVQALEAEIKRSRRTAQPLAVVLLDLDGLKQINDRHGHLAGSLAIRRVAEALLGSCRATDTAARFGGDEFALVLPETGEAAAWHVARGVVDRLATDAEKPNISISVGVAVYPGNGETVESLLNAADVALYETKERRKTKPSGLAT
ncbi:MAG TPA: MASE1 domain-containing protein [Gemmatimonadales bacterium]|nr:MASE1 domain-containing protein [Gemmatimonadales bacterium]